MSRPLSFSLKVLTIVVLAALAVTVLAPDFLSHPTLMASFHPRPGQGGPGSCACSMVPDVAPDMVHFSQAADHSIQLVKIARRYPEAIGLCTGRPGLTGYKVGL